MPRIFESEWSGFQNGEDSASAARDTLSVPNGYSERVENLIPSSGRLSPRPGSRFITTGESVWWMGDYQKAEGGYTLKVDAGDLYFITYTGSVSLLKAGWLDTPCKISQARVGKYLLLLADAEGKSLVVYEKSGTLRCFSAYLQNDANPIAKFDSAVSLNGESPLSVFGEPFTHTAMTSSETKGGWVVSLPRNITYTWVKLEGQDGNSFSLETGMPSAQVESWEDPSLRTACLFNKTTLSDGKKSPDTLGILRVTFAHVQVPEGATHIRLYMTGTGVLKDDSYEEAQAIADGLNYAWVADVPVGNLGGDILLKGTDGMLDACTNLAWSTNRDDLPPGGDVKFIGGRLWVAGGRSESNPGRSYFSALVDGSTDQLSRLLSFKYSTDYTDTSTDETEPMIGLGISQNNLIMFNARSVWALTGGNPDYAPQCIDSTRGAVGGITEVGQRIFYLSQEGPAVVSGTTIDDISNFKSSMTTPGIRNHSEFFQPRKTIRGMWHNRTWMLTDGERVACFQVDDGSTGTWRLSIDGIASFACSCSPRKGELWVGGGDAPILSLMDHNAVRDFEGNVDLETPILCRLLTNGTKVPKGVVSGEAYAIRTGTRWTDASQLRISLLGDHGRVADLYEFEDDTGTGSASGYQKSQRGDVLQSVRQGAVSHWFQVMLEKYVWNDSVLFGPITLECIPRNYHPESVSLSDPGRVEPILDGALLGRDPRRSTTGK